MFDFTNSLPEDTLPATEPWTGFSPFNFVGGHNDEALIPVHDLTDCMSAVMAADGKRLAAYGLGDGPLGYLGLRQFLAGSLHSRAGMRVDADDILLVSGSLQALDLVNQTLLRAGDTVVTEASNYEGVYARFNRLDVNFAGVPTDSHGMRVDALEQMLSELEQKGIRPSYIYTIPTVQNPTGSVMPEDRRRTLLALAKAFDVPVFEDDCYADLTFNGKRPPALHALDEDGRVIYCGSFSKTVAPALRVGYLVAKRDFLARALSYKSDAGSGALEQLVLSEFCNRQFDSHVEKLSAHLASKADIICSAIDKYFGASAEYIRPMGGIFIWVKLAQTVDTKRLAEVAGAHGVSINPGVEWSSASDAGQHMRLCFGYPDAATIDEGVKRLARICQAEFGLPSHIANQKEV